MSDATKNFVSVAGAIAFLWSASQVAVFSQTLQEEKRDASGLQRLAKLRSSNQEIRVPLRSRSVVLHLYLPQQATTNSPLVFYSSGSGGWHQFDDYIASGLAERGMLVCGISLRSYLKNFYSTSQPANSDQLVSDYRSLINQATTLIGVNQTPPLILSGWSLGAAYAALVASDPLVKSRVRGVIGISLSRDNEAALSVGNRLLSRLTGKTFGPSFDVSEYLSRTSPLPVAIIQSGQDRTASAKVANELIASASHNAGATCRLFNVETGHSHSFAGGRSDFDRALDEALGWINPARISK